MQDNNFPGLFPLRLCSPKWKPDFNVQFRKGYSKKKPNKYHMNISVKKRSARTAKYAVFPSFWNAIVLC